MLYRGVLADSWRDYFYCESMDADTLVQKGEKKAGGRSSNKKGTDNIISNGSIINVNDGQCMMIVESGNQSGFLATEAAMELINLFLSFNI